MKKSSSLRIAFHHSSNVFVAHLIIKGYLIKELMEVLFGLEKLLKILVTPTGAVIMFISSIIAILIGVLLSGWDLRRRQYIIENKKEIARLSFFIFAGISLLWNAIYLFIVSRAISVEFNIINTLIDILIMSFVLYIATIKLIKTTGTVSKV